MIGRVHHRGHNLARLLQYLYSPGRRAEHADPRLVGGWLHPAELEPPLRPDGRRDFRQLTTLMKLPLGRLGERAPQDYVWHCSVRAAPGNPVLGDGAWMRIAARIMDRTGLSPAGHEDEGVPWVAVHHGDQHIHIVAVLARQDGRRPSLHNDYYRIGEAIAGIEAEYLLVTVSRPDRTAERRPTRAEAEKAKRAGRAEPPRVTLRRTVAAAAAAARSEPEFWAALEQRGVQVRLRHSLQQPDRVTGYAVALPGDLTGQGQPVWFGGGRLAPDLSLVKLRRRWPGGPGRDRLSGTRMTDGAARAALRREVARVAAGTRSEAGFWAGLAAAGVLVRHRPGRDRPGQISGYAVSLPGMTHHRDGHQVWYGGWNLDQRMSLAALRRRWAEGRPGMPPGAEIFGEADAREIYIYAANVAADAARQLRSARGGQAADVAWAAADLIAAAAEAVGSPELKRAADGFARAGRAPWGRIPEPSPGGSMLRTAAWLLASCKPGGWGLPVARRALITALAGLARSLANLRAVQQRLLQAAAAREAAAGLAAIAAPAWPGPVPAVPPVPGRTGPGAPRARPGPRARAGPGPRAGPRLS